MGLRCRQPNGAALSLLAPKMPRERRGARRILGSIVLAVALVLPRHAHAQADETTAAARRELIEQAQRARDAGELVHALDLAGRAGRLSMTPSLRRFVAELQAEAGQFGSALRSAELCVQEAERAAAGTHNELHAAACRALADLVGPRAGRVVIRVTPPAPAGMHVAIGGIDLPDALWGVPFAVDPGRVAIGASAPEYNSLQREVDVASGVAVDVPIALERAPTTAATTSSAPIELATEHVTRTSAPPRRSGVGVGPALLASAGVASLAVGIVLYVLRNNAIATQTRDCADVTHCPDLASATSAHDNAVAYTNGSVAADVVGGVAIAGAAVWWIVAASNTDAPAGRASASIVPINGGWLSTARWSF